MYTYIYLWTFIILMVGTPGPANMLLMTAGATHGFVKLIPFLIGLVLGKLAMNLAVALGLVGLIDAYPDISRLLAFISAGFMAYLALRAWTPQNTNAQNTKTYGLWLGLMVHPLSPKSWMMVTLALTQFSGDFSTPFEKYALIPLSFVILQSVFHSLWCLDGALLHRRLSQNLWLHRGLILLTLIVILWALFQ